MADPVWLLVMFDLPTLTKEQRRTSTAYRNLLLDQGFSRAQLSVYCRYLINGTAALPVINFLKATVPAEGYVRILQLTDRQWAGGWHLFGTKYIEPEAPPDTLLLF
ncbi:CRISPR-associated endonuclease Cas2 [Gulosibacter sp. 10]|uniref:CRISPR-associated endonuclease Cas2 n=1 Tax=Gulosibacter sp. 10 TaxID=1255570 RepID=UPI000B355DF5|nr:CRISPR-associated endonuclease Cas2 [Gulosibacter sp. 10]